MADNSQRAFHLYIFYTGISLSDELLRLSISRVISWEYVSRHISKLLNKRYP
jgi:hypothetical protein